MSQEDVERLREGYESFGRGEEHLFLDLMHPEFRYRSREELPGGGEYEGRDVFFRRLAELRELFEDICFEPSDFVVSGDYVVATLKWSARGRGGGVRIAQDLVHVWRMRDDRAVELQVFSDKTQALESVVRGLAQ